MRKIAILLTGSAGFIGSNLARYFLNKKKIVLGIDNLQLGNIKNIKDLLNNKNFSFIKLDISNFNKLEKFIKKILISYQIKTIWHFAANSDIKDGFKNPDNDYKNTFLTTYNLIKIAKAYKVENFIFASSSAVYGDLIKAKLKESSGPLLPISNYGAMKLASEGVISAAKESFLKKAYIFRFPNVVGYPSTHGVIHDFIKKLKKNPVELKVLGNGKQKKIYMHVQDLISSMIFIVKNSKDKMSLFNIGPNDKGVTVKFISQEVARYFKKNKKIIFEKKAKGWVGDVPKFSYSNKKFKKLGFDIRSSSKSSIIKAVRELIK
jgi:UDP-glucose 4-epimerase